VIAPGEMNGVERSSTRGNARARDNDSSSASRNLRISGISDKCAASWFIHRREPLNRCSPIFSELRFALPAISRHVHLPGDNLNISGDITGVCMTDTSFCRISKDSGTAALRKTRAAELAGERAVRGEKNRMIAAKTCRPCGTQLF